MPNPVLRKPIVTPVDVGISELITNEATEPDEKREVLEGILHIIYQGQDTKPEGEDKDILLYALEDIICRRYEESRNRKSGALYVNHPISTSRVVALAGNTMNALAGNTMNVLAALYHDATEEYIEGEYRRFINQNKFIDEQTRLVHERINYLYESKAKETFGKSWSLIKERQRKSLRKSIKEEINKFKEEITQIKEQAKEREEKAKKKFLSQEPELIGKYLTNLERDFSAGLILRGINEQRAREISQELVATVSALTRSVDDNYYKAVDKIISPRDELSPETKFRGVLVKFSDCLVNTEIIDDKVYPLKELVGAVRANDTEALKKFARLTEEANKRHKREDKTGRVLGHKRVYRIFKNYFLINSYRTYKHHMDISNVFSLMREQDVLKRAMITEGLLEDMINLTKNYYQHKNIAGEPSGSWFNALETLRKFSEQLQNQQELSDPDKNDPNKRRDEFVKRCVRSGYFMYIHDINELEILLDKYARESQAFEQVRQSIDLFEKVLIERNYECAKAILEHLVSYHGLPPQLEPIKIVEILDTNMSYIHAKGYHFVTKPSDSTKVQVETSKVNGDLEVTLVNGTRKSLATPDGLIVMFIDAKVRGEDARLDELYSNKTNMFWAALAAKTLGYSYKHDKDFVLTGLDTKGAHPTGAVTK